jgi:hypothetical protein
MKVHASSETGEVMMRYKQKPSSVTIVPMETLIITVAVVVISPPGFGRLFFEVLQGQATVRVAIRG